MKIDLHNPWFVIFVIFFILKITEIINWSWWWVTAPLWIPTVAGLLLILIGYIITVAKLPK